MSPALLVVLWSAVPIAEMKVGIPIGIAKGVDPILATMLGIFGTLIQLPFNLLFLRLLVKIAERVPLARRFYVWSRYRARKHRPVIRKWGVLGVALLVAIPIPGTGLFTGTVAASLIGMGYKPMALGLAIGTACAGILVGLASSGVFRLLP